MVRVRIAFKGLSAVGALHTKLIGLVLLNNERQVALPNTVADFFEHIFIGLPLVKITGNGNRLGIWRPHAADHTLFPIHYSFMYPHKVICFYVGSLMEQIKRQVSVI